MILKKPSDCSNKEPEDFKKLVLAGGQVTAKGLGERIMNCKILDFYYVDKELVGVSAIKQKSKETVKRTLNRAKIKRDNIPTLELGYSFTKQKFRGQGVNKKINDGLLDQIPGERIFATTDNDTIRKYLSEKGFKKLGQPFKGEFNETLDYFESDDNSGLR